MANKKYTDEMKQWLRDNSHNKYIRDICKEFNGVFGTNTTITAMGALLNKLGIKSDVKKGKPTHNKGKKWDDYMSKESQEKSRQTTFKKGNIPHNTLPVGTEMIDSRGYTWVKCSTRTKSGSHKYMRYKHHVIYEQHHGEIPNNACIIFLDGDKQNFDVNNLALVTRYEQRYMNRFALRVKGDTELTKLGVLVAKIQFKKKELRKCRETH